MMKRIFLVPIFIITILFSACSTETASELKGGYYTAETADFDAQGWKEYITIYVSDNKIITVEYNAYNASGFVKSWDMGYMRKMKKETQTYPNEYARTYAVSLLNWQDPDKVDAISGAEGPHASFQLLAKAVIAQAKAGNKQVAIIKSPKV